MRTTKEIFHGHRSDCFSRKNFSWNEKTRGLLRRSAEKKLHISGLQERIKNLSLEIIEKDTFILQEKGGNCGVIHIELEGKMDEKPGFVWGSYIPGGDRKDELFGEKYGKYFVDTDHFQGGGYGTLLYIMGGIYSLEHESRLHSDTCGMPKVKWIWNSLISSGIAEFDADERVFRMNNNKLEEYFL